MKRQIFCPAILCAALLVAGCASTASHTTGRDIRKEVVGQIQKGKTTTDELVAMLGEPDAKAVISATEEKWTYQYIFSTATVNYFVVTNIESSGTRKMLDVLVKDGLVINYAYTEGPLPGMSLK